jgi:hypothetical protein
MNLQLQLMSPYMCPKVHVRWSLSKKQSFEPQHKDRLGAVTIQWGSFDNIIPAAAANCESSSEMHSRAGRHRFFMEHWWNPAPAATFSSRSRPAPLAPPGSWTLVLKGIIRLDKSFLTRCTNDAISIGDMKQPACFAASCCCCCWAPSGWW